MADATSITDTVTLDAVSVTATSTSGSGVSSGVLTGTTGTPSGPEVGTDVVYQEIKLYIEGVQVPFISMSISSNIGQSPYAAIEVPPQAGLMDIARYYQPKVHVFYTDNILGGERLLFWGHIAAVAYQRSKGQGSASIQFTCVHKNELLKGVTLDYTGYGNTNSSANTNPSDSAIKVNSLTSTLGIINALKGTTGVQTADSDKIVASNAKLSTVDTSLIDSSLISFEKRLLGMPGTVINFWNQLKRDGLSNPKLNQIFIKLYMPLVEEGLAYFERLTGHYSLETQVDGDRAEYCPHDVPSSKSNILIPPSRKINSTSAIQSAMTVEAIQSNLGYSGQLTDFGTLLTNFFYSIEYELITLASPATVAVDPSTFSDPDNAETFATVNRSISETIIKPQTPFYYAPICNVVFSSMFSSITVSQQEDQVPTRVSAVHDLLPSSGGTLSSFYRAPHSIREAVAIGASQNATETSSSATTIGLLDTTQSSYNTPGKYEQGRGVIPRNIIMPNWLAMFVSDKAPSVGSPAAETWPENSSQKYTDIVAAHSCWVDRYGYDITQSDATISRTRNAAKDPLDPASPLANIAPWQRILFETVDYEFTKQVAQSRSGSIEALFNPYIIPGYPMDIIDESPNYPSFHAMCGSVTHSITNGSISTTIGFMAATTYAEMSNYYIPPLHPWLEKALNMNNPVYSDISASASTESAANYGAARDTSSISSTLINNPIAKAAADDYYKSVLGITSADPSILYDFSTGAVSEVSRASGLWSASSESNTVSPNGGEATNYKSSMGNMRLVSRQIETKADITARFNIGFVEFNETNYTQSGASYLNPILDTNITLEPGASLFLDYEESKTFLAS